MFRAALALAAAGIAAGAFLRILGVVPQRSPFVLADLRWIFLAECALLLVVWRLPHPSSAAGGPAVAAPPGHGVAAAAVVAVGLLTYWPGLGVHLFDSDDWAPMYGSAWILQDDSLARLARVIYGGYAATRPTGFSDVLTALVHFVVFAGFGTNAWAYHGLALAVHLATAALVVFLARRLGAGAGPSAAAGLFFVLFPPNHEIVSLPSFFSFGLVTTFMLGACLALPAAGEPRPRRGRWLALLFAVLALLTKETAVFLPVIALLVLAAEDGRGVAAAWRRHRATVVPLFGAVGLYLCAAGVNLAFGVRSEMEWNIDTTTALHGRFWTNPRAVFEMLTGVLPVNFLTPITKDLFPGAFAAAAAVLASGFAAAVALLGWCPPPRRGMVPLFAAWALTPVVAGPLLRYPVAYAEKTHYYHAGSVALSLAFGFMFNAGFQRRGRPILRVAAGAAAAALLVFNLYTIHAILEVREWFGGMVGRASAVFAAAYRALPPGETVYLVCDDDGIDRGGMEPLIFHNAMKNPPRNPIHLIARLRIATGNSGGGGGTDGGVAFAIAAGPGVRLFGWDRDRNDFGELDPGYLLRLAAAQSKGPAAASPGRPIRLEWGGSVSHLQGEVHMDATPAAILRRM